MGVRRYDRFGRDEILGLPAAILGAPAHVFDDVPVPGALLVPVSYTHLRAHET